MLELGTELSDLVRTAQPDPDLRRRLQEERAEVYELLLQYRLDSTGAGPEAPSRIEAAFATTERLRSRTLLDTLSTAELRPPEGVPAGLVDREAVLLRERTALERGAPTNWERLRSVKRELRGLWSAMAAHHVTGEEYAAVRSSAAVTADSALARLCGSQAVVASFHDLTLSGEPPAQALRAAMLAARALPGGDRLDRWAAFCLLGEWRAERGPDGGPPRSPLPNGATHDGHRRPGSLRPAPGRVPDRGACRTHRGGGRGRQVLHHGRRGDGPPAAS
ncbi:hypothetical protein ACWGQ4_11210 [Streptomyces sp. NPDC055721]|uniref:hypothetical protein n=1 Tax=Streptomyces sp. NPDC127132 TaxID=3345374 RepID=UPI00363E2704